MARSTVCPIPGLSWIKIPLDHLRWYAAFHRKEHSAHIHLVLFSTDPKEGYLTKQGIEPNRVEGRQSAQWILLDYYDVMVHIFLEEARNFYNLERLWSDAPQVDISDLLTRD